MASADTMQSYDACTNHSAVSVDYDDETEDANNKVTSKRWLPKGTSNRRGSLTRGASFKNSKLFSSFKISKDALLNMSSHRAARVLSRGESVDEEEQAGVDGARSRSSCGISSHSNSSSSAFSEGSSRSGQDLADLLQDLKNDDSFLLSLKEAAPQHDMLLSKPQPVATNSQPEPRPRRPLRRPSTVSSDGGSFSELDFDQPHIDNDLDISAKPTKLSRSESMLASLSDKPSSEELSNVAAVCASEYINECLFGGEAGKEGIIIRDKWENIPQYSKNDLVIQKFLGKGSYSDAFEVCAMVPVETDKKKIYTSDTEDIDRLLDRKFGESFKSSFETKVERAVDESIQEGGNEEDDLDAQIDAMFDVSTKSPPKIEEQRSNSITDVVQGPTSLKSSLLLSGANSSPEFKPASINPPPRRSRGRRQTVDYGAKSMAASFCVRKTAAREPTRKKPVVYAMKCLRPQIRSNVDHFIVGVEDLVHETVMLASLDHINIIKIHGRAVCSSNRLSDGYFILLDKLQDTLSDRIGRWKKTSTGHPSVSQIKTAYSIANALAYLHSKNIIFRDLKPANVGFDELGVLKLFDFGFATELESSNEDEDRNGKSQPKLLTEICGTPRYMAPEVGLERGYSLPADVYSFGILLWEMCTLKKPFANVKSADEFHKSVFEKGARPKLSSKYLSPVLKDTIKNCWSSFPAERPSMEFVKKMLDAHVRDLSSRREQSTNQMSLRNSSVFRRLTG